jgi:hypothetical protein
MIQWEDNEEKKREERKQQGPKAGKYDRSIDE